MKKALGCFEQATEKMPEYALAYAGIADVYNHFALYSLRPPREVYPKARAAAVRSIEIDDTLAEAHASLAFIKTWYGWDWKASEKEFKKAIELNPLYPETHMYYSNYLLYMARFDEAIREAEEAVALDPLSLANIRSLGGIYFSAGLYDRAIEVLQKVVEMEPNFPRAHLYLGIAFAQQSLNEEALVEFEKEREISAARDPGAEIGVGVTFAFLGRRDEANQILDNLMERSKEVYVPSSLIARLKLALGKIDQGFELLEQAYEERDQFLPMLKVENLFDVLDLRTDPRYTALLRKMNLEP